MLSFHEVPSKHSTRLKTLHNSLVNIIFTSMVHCNIWILVPEVLSLLLSCLVHFSLNLIFDLLFLILIFAVNMQHELKIYLLILNSFHFCNIFLINSFAFKIINLFLYSFFQFRPPLALSLNFWSSKTSNQSFVVAKVEVLS